MPRTVATTHRELVHFLLDRVDEDETEVKRRARKGILDSAEADRLRAEAIAKRRIIGTVQHLLVLRDQPSEQVVRDAALQILSAMAAPYSSHASFRSEWQVSRRH